MINENAPNVIGIIQARMGSSRVPGTALIDLAGKPLLWHMLDRMRRVEGVGKVILATTTDRRNDRLRDFAEQNEIDFFAYEIEDDLAGRIAGAIKHEQGDFILKTGGDCPFVDPDVLQLMVDTALSNPNADFVSNRINWSYPLGLSADVISRSAIEWANKNLKAPEDRELFALYIRDHPDQFKVIPIVHKIDLSHHIWTVDEPNDVEFTQKIFKALYKEGEVFKLQDVLDYLQTGKK